MKRKEQWKWWTLDWYQWKRETISVIGWILLLSNRKTGLRVNDCGVTAGKQRGRTVVKTVEPLNCCTKKRRVLWCPLRGGITTQLERGKKDRRTIIKLAVVDKTGGWALLFFKRKELGNRSDVFRPGFYQRFSKS